MVEKFNSKNPDELKYKNSALPIDERVKDLLGRMTLEEKIAQMVCIWNKREELILDDDKNLDFEKLRKNLKHGMGQIGRISDTNGGKKATELAEYSNAIQKYFVEETRLGIPVVFHEECLHGLMAKEATSYPQPIGLAATFNPDMIEKIYAAVAEDARSRGTHQALTPVLDVMRDPRWGRVEETFGEDPYLITQMGTAAVKGFQGDGNYSNKKHVMATLKHFAAHGDPESGNNCAPVNVSERILRDIFLVPFKEVIENAKPDSVMASYNEIDGVPSHANKWLLRDVLRKEWGFEGFVVSDYFAIGELNIRDEAVSHQVAKDKIEAGYLAVKAGVNIELPDPDGYTHLGQLVKEGKLKEAELDELVEVLLRYKFKMGLFEEPYVKLEQSEVDEKLEKDRPLALQAAQETITLLKNENNILPLKLEKGQTIAVIGPNADREMLGGYSGYPKYSTNLLQGIKKKVKDNYNILYSEGCQLTIGGGWWEDEVVFADEKENKKLIREAVKTAEQADFIVLALGGNEQTSREAWDKGHLGDRTDLDLFGMQNELVTEINKLGKPTVAVVFNGRPLSIVKLQETVPAILECWYLGQESGNAIAEVLFGDVNPSGKLPISFPRSVGHIPCFYNHKPSARRGYLNSDVTPLYPFGFGLSYTNFKYENARLEKSKIKNDESTKLLVDVTNSGKLEGSEVVQLYIRDCFSTVTRPVKELKGFEKIRLAPGETKTVTLEILPKSLAYTDINMEFRVEPGDFEIMVGGSSSDEDLTRLTLTVTD
jgi:beta-glucosidase